MSLSSVSYRWRWNTGDSGCLFSFFFFFNFFWGGCLFSVILFSKSYCPLIQKVLFYLSWGDKCHRSRKCNISKTKMQSLLSPCHLLPHLNGAPSKYWVGQTILPFKCYGSTRKNFLTNPTEILSWKRMRDKTEMKQDYHLLPCYYVLGLLTLHTLFNLVLIVVVPQNCQPFINEET